MSLARCPKCGQQRFDTVAKSCERRQCGYEEPEPMTTKQKVTTIRDLILANRAQIELALRRKEAK